MNLLLLSPGELSGDYAWIDGRRAEHLLGLLAKVPGDRVRVGVLGDGLCDATVTEVERNPERVRLVLGARHPQPLPKTSVILALPRPKALSRIVQLAASLGVARVDLVQTVKVDKAYFSSPRLEPARLHEDALLGLEQGGLVHPPTFQVHRSLRKFLEHRGRPQPGEQRVLFDPSATLHLAAVLASAPADPSELAHVTLAFGPDGGFTLDEIEAFTEAGFAASTLSPSTLRTEVAVAVGLGQLELARRLG